MMLWRPEKLSVRQITGTKSLCLRMLLLNLRCHLKNNVYNVKQCHIYYEEYIFTTLSSMHITSHKN
jgi:hypothetical protein